MIINFTKIAISLFFLLSLLSCNRSTGPLFVHEQIPTESDPNLFIYRPESNYLKAAKWEFLIDNDKVVTLTNGTYAKISIAPGKHEIVSGMSQKVGQLPLSISIDAAEGKNVYVKYEIKMQRSILMSLIDKPKFDNRLSEVEEIQALIDLKELCLTTVSDRSR